MDQIGFSIDLFPAVFLSAVFKLCTAKTVCCPVFIIPGKDQLVFFIQIKNRFIVFLQDRVQTCQISAYINIHDHYAFLQLHFLVNGDHAAPITCICRCPGLHQTFFVRSHGTVTAVPVVLSFRLQLLQSII